MAPPSRPEAPLYNSLHTTRIGASVARFRLQPEGMVENTTSRPRHLANRKFGKRTARESLRTRQSHTSCLDHSCVPLHLHLY
ncbi:uncharacterized protein CCOS01_04736 [Colletotrichum costaricense]|uniref:Uncharacterized protein n=1 Tax=Colletotrichum costaricense TaxID=1209916 RepID=A0AAI9Z4J0_9PEZI|nr:uncharacterized protein CCOS01_04736 [Colletotrichum costaricense]KAK1532753.1 hypothetical protein CCOS01_04736 [Colletotrichum costaricense]